MLLASNMRNIHAAVTVAPKGNENGDVGPTNIFVVEGAQLELLEEKLSQEDVNQKLLRSLSPEWNTHAIVWRNKAVLDTMSMDDLYNNLKVYEPEVKEMSSSSLSTQNIAFVSSSNKNTSNTNGAVNTAHGIFIASIQVNVAYSINIDNLSNAGVQSSKKSRQQEQGELKNECACGNIYFTALVSCDGLGGYDWSDRAEERHNYALMAFSSLSFDSEVSNDSICLKSCLETIELLKSQNDKLLKDLKKSELIVLGEIIIRDLRKNLEIVQKEKDGIQLNVDKFEHASKSLNKLIECQIVDNCKKGLGYKNYNAVLPPYTGNFMPPTPDLSFTGLDEFVNKPVVENYKAMFSAEETKGTPQMDLQNQGVIDSGCSRHMTGNMSYLTDYEEIDCGYVAFRAKRGKIIGKGTIKTGNLDFENVYFVREIKFNLFSVSQLVSRKNNMYSVDLKNIVPKGGLTFFSATAINDESKLWHRRLGHLCNTPKLGRSGILGPGRVTS
nr:hypothetical protein [Tanacetum cinerariifolium]